jgi:hypothetical protein
MTKESLTLSHQELNRLSLVESIIAKRITQHQASIQLRLSTRQVKRLVRAYRLSGAAGLQSKHRGRQPNNAISQSIRQQALALIKQHYDDFSPTFAHQKLTEQHGLVFSVETLRQWMMTESIWQSTARRKAAIHQSRPRRSCWGELIQIDGSPHDWLEGRAPKCTLIVFIDDATSQLMALKFSPTETTQAYMETLQDYCQQHGRPVALYSDKHSIFRVNYPDKEGEITQFTRAMKTLDIAPIHANTPQAKGRVERANLTLQDRLVKEMRLQGIDNIADANAFLPIFIQDYNQRFAVAPRCDDNAHRPLLHTSAEMDIIMTRHHSRKLSKNLTFQFKNTEYQLQGYGNGYRLRGASITVCEPFAGDVTLLHEGKTLTYRQLQKGQRPIPIEDEKTIAARIDQIKQQQQQKPQWKPSIDHPWKRQLKAASTENPSLSGGHF